MIISITDTFKTNFLTKREEKEIPYFLVPQTFSRFDSALEKLFRRELNPEISDNNFIGNCGSVV